MLFYYIIFQFFQFILIFSILFEDYFGYAVADVVTRKSMIHTFTTMKTEMKKNKNETLRLFVVVLWFLTQYHSSFTNRDQTGMFSPFFGSFSDRPHKWTDGSMWVKMIIEVQKGGCQDFLVNDPLLKRGSKGIEVQKAP